MTRPSDAELVRLLRDVDAALEQLAVMTEKVIGGRASARDLCAEVLAAADALEAAEQQKSPVSEADYLKVGLAPSKLFEIIVERDAEIRRLKETVATLDKHLERALGRKPGSRALSGAADREPTPEQVARAAEAVWKHRGRYATEPVSRKIVTEVKIALRAAASPRTEG